MIFIVCVITLGCLILAAIIGEVVLKHRTIVKDERVRVVEVDQGHRVEAVQASHAQAAAYQRLSAELKEQAALHNQHAERAEKHAEKRAAWEATAQEDMNQWARRTENLEGKVGRMGPGLGGRG